MTTGQRIEGKLNVAFAPDFIEVVNESHMHSVPANSETHFKVTLVTEKFAGLRLVRRHQDVYKVLDDELKSGVHALALHTYTPDEWQGRAPDSPQCRGGSKKQP
ncbi:MAG: BolA/IbaG family iron-sulfur metabolism protein [Porticoccaceae bacterium]